MALSKTQVYNQRSYTARSSVISIGDKGRKLPNVPLLQNKGTVQRQIIRGPDTEQNTINLTRTILEYKDFGTTYTRLNQTEFPGGNADNALTGPALRINKKGEGDIAVSVYSEPINTVSTRIELPAAPPWTAPSTLGYLAGRIQGTGDGFSISDHILGRDVEHQNEDGEKTTVKENAGAAATLSVGGLPNDTGFAALVKAHEMHHVNDVTQVAIKVLLPWDKAIKRAIEQNTEVHGASVEEATGKLYKHLGGTPSEIGNKFNNESRIKGLAYHRTQIGSTPSIDNTAVYGNPQTGYMVRVYFKHPAG